MKADEGWVTNPDALETLLLIRAAEVGDQIRERYVDNVGSDKDLEFALGPADELGYVQINRFYKRYPKGTLRDDGRYRIVAWRRPLTPKQEVK